MKLRVLLHALDRTGPPMLALALVRWIIAERPGTAVDVVAFRGGDMEPEFSSLVGVAVLLDPHERWDHLDPDPHRVEEVRSSVAHLEMPDVTLLVSVAAGQCLTLLPSQQAPVVTWVVEQGEDLHWLDPPVSVVDRSDHWLAGSHSSLGELQSRLGPNVPIQLVHEFIEDPLGVPSDDRSGFRQQIGVSPDQLLVLGCGIGTWRKAPDLFFEVALQCRRSGLAEAAFAWFGGESDDLLTLVRAHADMIGAGDVVLWRSSTPEIDRLCASADVLLHTARLDAFPLVCLHAAANGTPVLAFEGVGGVPEMLGPEFRGVPYPDVAGLARLLQRLHFGGHLKELAARQQDRVRQHFVSSVAAARVVERLELATTEARW